MGKRFTDTDKWSKGWFGELSTKHKLLWVYLCDACDHAGIWPENYKLASFHFGEEVSRREVLEAFGDKVSVFDEDKLYLNSFVNFQYGQLRDNNSAHLSVIKKLRHHGIDPKLEYGYSGRPSAIMERLSVKKKKEIMSKDHYKCTYCGIGGDEASLVIDHIIPRAKGGENEDNNLTTACIRCNSTKTDVDVELFISSKRLEDGLSKSLRDKLSLIRTLTAPNKELQGAKEEEEDKDKDKDKEKDKEKEEWFKRESLTRLVKIWGETLTHYGIVKDPKLDEVTIARIVRIHGIEKTTLALRGASREERSDKFDPKANVSILRLLKPNIFEKFVNLGANEQKKSLKEILTERGEI